MNVLFCNFFSFLCGKKRKTLVSYLTWVVIFILYMFLSVKCLFIYFLNKKDKAFNLFSASCLLSYKKEKRFRIWTGYQVQVHFSQFSCLQCLFSERVELQTMSSSVHSLKVVYISFRLKAISGITLGAFTAVVLYWYIGIF